MSESANERRDETAGPQVLAADIAEERERLGETVEELARRVHPAHQVQTAKDEVQAKAHELKERAQEGAAMAQEKAEQLSAHARGALGDADRVRGLAQSRTGRGAGMAVLALGLTALAVIRRRRR